jgi:hypothetical protein
MSRISGPYHIYKRPSTKRYQLTIYPVSGLPASVCAAWVSKSFANLPPELAQYRELRTKAAAEGGSGAAHRLPQASAFIRTRPGGGVVFQGLQSVLSVVSEQAACCAGRRGRRGASFAERGAARHRETSRRTRRRRVKRRGADLAALPATSETACAKLAAHARAQGRSGAVAPLSKDK